MSEITPVKSSFTPDPVDDGWFLDVDDGWFLDEEPDPYHEYVVERTSTAIDDERNKQAAPNRRGMYSFVYGAVAPLLNSPS